MNWTVIVTLFQFAAFFPLICEYFQTKLLIQFLTSEYNMLFEIVFWDYTWGPHVTRRYNCHKIGTKSIFKKIDLVRRNKQTKKNISNIWNRHLAMQ